MNPYSHHHRYNQRPPSPQHHMNVITLCGCTRSKCGYCKGSRTDILGIPNPDEHDVASSSTLFHDDVEESEASKTAVRTGKSKTPCCPMIIHVNNTNNDNDSNDSIHDDDVNFDDNNEKVTPSTSSKAYSMIASNIHPSDYQKLLNSGWRRSGDLLYLPKNWESCCPSHPIRLDVNRFRIGKSHKKVLRNLNIALQGSSSNSALDPSTFRGSQQNDSSSDRITTGRKRPRNINVIKNVNDTKPMTASTLRDNAIKSDSNCSDNSPMSISKTISPPIHQQKLPSNDQLHQYTKDNINSCDLLSWLHDTTRQTVQNYLFTHLQANKNNTGSDDNDMNKRLSRIIEHCSNFKISKMNKPKNICPYQNLNQQHLQPWWKYNISTTLSSTICPALHGASRGEVDKKLLAEAIVQKLKYHDAAVSNKLLQSVGNDNSHSFIDQIKIELISFHEQSCHINIMLNLTMIWKNDSVNTMDGHNEDDTPRKNMQDFKDISNKKKMETVISDFIQSLTSETIESHSSLQPPYKLTIRSVPSYISGRDPQVFRLYCKYQEAIHNDPDPFTNMRNEDTTIKDVFELEQNSRNSNNVNEGEQGTENSLINPGHYSENGSNLFDKSQARHEKLTIGDFAQLYQRCYDDNQIQIMYKSYSEYHRFLCSSPVSQVSDEKSTAFPTLASIDDKMHNQSDNSLFTFDVKDEDVNIPYGSYHQYYLINDKYLIAVGVIDVLPNCISSVYAFYDPIVSRHINLGKLTALYEIEWIRHARRFRPDLRYYYLGYYIHSCQKMRYKAEYKPSDILCPVNGVWVDFDVAKKRLESRSPVRHCCDLATSMVDRNSMKSYDEISVPREEGNIDHLNEIKIAISRNSRLVTLNMLTDEGIHLLRPVLKDFVNEVGLEFATRNCVIKLF